MKGTILIFSFAISWFCLVGCETKTPTKPAEQIRYKGGRFKGIDPNTIVDSMIAWVEMRNDAFHSMFLNQSGWEYIPNTHMNHLHGSSKPLEGIQNYAGGGYNEQTDDANFWITRLIDEKHRTIVGLDFYQEHNGLFEEILKTIELKGKKTNSFISEKSECESWLYNQHTVNFCTNVFRGDKPHVRDGQNHYFIRVVKDN